MKPSSQEDKGNILVGEIVLIRIQHSEMIGGTGKVSVTIEHSIRCSSKH